MGRLLRPLISIALALAGAALLVYGAAAHQEPVSFEEEITIPAPPRLDDFPPPGLPRKGFMPQPFVPPGPPKTAMVLRQALEPEYHLVLEATRGGLARLPEGQLKRTYSGAPPSGCPT